MKKGIESFIYVLVAGIALLILGSLLSGQFPSFPGWFGIGGGPVYYGGGGYGGVGYTPSERIIFNDTIGQVGAVGETIRHIDLGKFDIGYALGISTVYSESLEIKNGIFSQYAKEFTFSGVNATRAILIFNISDTNRYGILEVVLNGKVVRSIDKKGPYSIEMKSLDKNNTLTIRATSSGLKFWAPTTYILKDVELKLEAYGEQRRTITFTLYEQEVEKWMSGRVAFWLNASGTNSAANLIIEINGNSVYNGIPSTFTKQDFTKLASAVTAGENTIVFRTGKGATYSLQDVELIIFYYGTGEYLSVTRSFSISSDYLSALNTTNGEISFTVGEAPYDRGLNLTLNNKTIEFSSLAANQTYTSSFAYADVKDKGNQLKLTTKGSYKIGLLKIRIP